MTSLTHTRTQLHPVCKLDGDAVATDKHTLCTCVQSIHRQCGRELYEYFYWYTVSTHYTVLGLSICSFTITTLEPPLLTLISLVYACAQEYIIDVLDSCTYFCLEFLWPGSCLCSSAWTSPVPWHRTNPSSCKGRYCTDNRTMSPQVDGHTI